MSNQCLSAETPSFRLLAHPAKWQIARPQQLMSVRPPAKFCPDISHYRSEITVETCGNNPGSQGKINPEVYNAMPMQHRTD